MRPARPSDVPELTRLWRERAARGDADSVPSGPRLEMMLSAFDWEARSRAVERDGRLVAAVMVTDRALPRGTVARLEFAGEPEEEGPLLDWGLRLSRAAGARAAQVWRIRGRGRGLPELGMRVVRPFWRMDRPHLEGITRIALPDGYRLVADDDDPGIPAATWVAIVNAAFAEHWQHVDKRVEELERMRSGPDHRPGLSVLALDGRGEPGAVILAHLERHGEEDRRAQPVGLVGIVGTHPGHRRRGLALALLSDVLGRLRAAGAASASLYVDGLNASRAADVYRRAGFEVAYELEVWEAALAT